MRNEKRWQDIEEVLAAGIDVISTVNVQHLESLNDAIFELTEIRVRETFPDRILEEADEVVLVDLSPEELQQRLRAGKVYPKERAEVALENFFRADKLAALRELALREVAEDVEARRTARMLEPLSKQAVAERVLALVEPEPRSQRIMRRAWRSAQRLGAQLDALWVRKPGPRADREEQLQLAALRRLAVVLGAHFLEEEGDDFVEHGTSRRERARLDVCASSARRTRARRREILRGSLVSALVRELAGRRHPRHRRPSDRDRPAHDRRRHRARRAGLGAGAGGAKAGRHGGEPARGSSSRSRGVLESTVLSAAIRIARAEEARARAAYLLVVPLEYPEDSPQQEQVAVAMPLLEAVEHAALREGVPVDARIEKGRSLTHACGGCGRSKTSTASSPPRRRTGAAASHRRTSPGSSPTPRSRRSSSSPPPSGAGPLPLVPSE